MADGFEVYARAYARAFELRPDMSTSEWADRYRVLTSKSSGEATRWSTARTPYLREIMDSLGPNDPVQRVVVMKGARIGGTEAITNAIGQWIHHEPCPILVVQPDLGMARSYSAQFLEPMIDTSPALTDMVAKRHSKTSRNRTLFKETRGGSVRVVGAKSPRAFRMVLARLVLKDDRDGFERTVGNEGDPGKLADMRAATFGDRRKLATVSTPTIKGDSPTEAEYLLSDQRRYFVPCPHCGDMDWIRWDRIKYVDERPESAELLCEKCGALIEEGHKTAMLAGGEWRATAESEAGIRGFHISGLYSPLGWFSWADAVQQFLDAKHDPSKLRVFVNTVLGETYEERPHDVDPTALLARREDYGDGVEVPHGVGLLTLEVDTQDDSLVWHVMGWGASEESWNIDYGQISGDPGTAEPWRELDTVRERRYRHASGRLIPIAITVIDAGGHHWDEVLAYTRPRLGHRVFAVKGDKDQAKQLVGKPSIDKAKRARFFVLGVAMGKDTVGSRLRIRPPERAPGSAHTPAPGYIHLPFRFPSGQEVDNEYAAQLASEVREPVHVMGRGWTRRWVAIRDRNEIWDLHVYALAALRILGDPVIRTLGARARAFSEPLSGAAPQQDRPTFPPSVASTSRTGLPLGRPRLGGGFISGRRRRF